MPQGNARNRSRGRRYRNRRLRAQRPAAVAESPRNDEREMQPEETPEAVNACSERVNDEEDSKTTEDDSATPESGDLVVAGEDCGAGSCRFRPDERRSIEKIELRSFCPRIVEITTISSLPLEATIGHIAGVGILETGIGDKATKDSTTVTISEPVEAIRPLGERVRTKCRLHEGEDVEWTNRLEIREVSDSDAEADCGRPTIVEIESDAEREPSGARDLAAEHHGGSKPRNRLGQQQFAPQKKLAKSEAEYATLMWDTVMPREVERKLRNFIEGLQLPSFSEEVTEEDGRFSEKLSRETATTAEAKSPEKTVATSRRKTRKRANSESHFANNFLDIIQEEGERLSEDEAQHIRDFINSEISKYRREDRHSTEKTVDPAKVETTEGRVCDITINIDTSECDVARSDDRCEGDDSATSVDSAENNASSETEATSEPVGEPQSNAKSPDESDEPKELTTNEKRSDSSIADPIDGRIDVSEIGAVSDVDEEELASGKQEDVNNNSSVKNISTGNDVNDVKRVEDDRWLIKVETVRGSEECDFPRLDPIETRAVDNHGAPRSADEVARALQNGATSSEERRPPPPPKRSSSLGQEPPRPPTPFEIDRILNGADVQQPLASCEIEVANERAPRRPELSGGGSFSRSDQPRTRADEIRGFPRGSSSIVCVDEMPRGHARQVKLVDTSSTTRNAAEASGAGGPPIASSGIRDAGTLGVALASTASTEITLCEKGKLVTSAASTAQRLVERDAESSRQVDENEPCECPSAEENFEEGSPKANQDASAMAGQTKGDDKSHAHPSCSVENNSSVFRAPSGTRDERKLGEEEENGQKSMSSYRHERTVKSETSETRIIERREESSNANQRNGPRNSKYSTWESRREESRREEKYEERREETHSSSRRSDARNSSDDEASFRRTDVAANPSPESEPADLQGHDSSSSTASLSTVKHCPLEASLTDINAIIRETKSDDSQEETDESLKRKLTLLKNGGGLAGDVSGESSESPQPVPYSPVEDLHYTPFKTDKDMSARAQVFEDSPLRLTSAQPSSLRELCVKKILLLPFGPQVISEITTPRLNIFESLRTLQRFVSSVPSVRRDNARLNPHGVIDRRPRGAAGLTKATRGSEPPPNDLENAVSECAKLLPENVNIETRLSESETEMGHHWRGLSTSEDPRLLVCLSPSQQATSGRVSADALLDLHRKFLNRYSYREEQPQSVPLPQYRVQVRPMASSLDQGDDDAREPPKPPARALQRDTVGRSSNRLLEIIKEHADVNVSRNGPLADRQSKIMNDESLNRCTFGGQERLKAARLSDCLNQARYDCRSAAADELFLAAAGGEVGRDDKPSHVAQGDQSRIATRCVGHRPSNDAAIARDSKPRPDASGSFAPSSAVVDRSSGGAMDAGKRTPPWRTVDPGKHVNPALIDDKLEVPPLPKRTVTVDRSCIDTTSIFDQNPPRSHLEPRRGHETAEKLKHVAAAEIMDKLKKLQTDTSRRLDGDKRRGSLPQEYFAQQLKYVEMLEEQLKNVILAEEEERKAFEELQTHVRRTRRCDDAKKSPLIDIPEEMPGKTGQKTSARERKIPIELRDDTTGEKCARSKLEECRLSEENPHLTSEKKSEPEVQAESWREKSRRVEKDRTETIDKAGSRQFRRKVYHENGVHEEESSESIEHEEHHVISGKGDARAPKNVAPKSRENNVDKRRAETPATETPRNTATEVAENATRSCVRKNVAAKKLSTLPTNGEAFRQRMYDEYVHKVLERQERKNHKVVKISSHEDIRKVNGESSGMSAMAKEFIEKARSRLSKFGIDLDENGTEREEEEEEEERRGNGAVIKAKCLIDGKELEDARKLPKHLREFLKISTMTDDDGTEGGVWSPGQTPPAKEPSPDRSRQPPKDEAIPPVWTPASAGASPIAERKEFRPVPFESPVLSRKERSKEEEATPPWGHEEGRKENSRSVYESSASRIVNSYSAPAQGLNTLASTPRLPRAQNPTITLLQKAREGQLPKGAAYLEESEFADSRPPCDERPLISPGEILYTVKKEYESEPETDNEPTKKMADLGPRKFEGIGPVTKEGVPLVLRSEVKESNQAKWYKKMYDSLHRADRNDDYVTIRYKPRRGGRYGYGSSSGYLSEPESRAYSDRSVTLDSRRRLRNKENDFTTATMPRKSGALKYSSDVYKNQPGRIEDYEPGHSSIAEKEAKEPFEQRNARATKPYMTHALKESGYESDSTLVFRRKEDITPLSLLQQRLAYKTVQSGGDVPLHGLRKPAPERAKESPRRYVEGEVTIHYRSPVRTEAKEPLSEEELARRSAENMRRVYAEERRRKYFQELHDIHSRRHTDNFTPSQKSPIPLNRYDDFVDDLSQRSRSQDQTPEPRLVARALYNFIGQSSRELTFRRGDIIFIRRQVDKNWYEGEYKAMIGLLPYNYVEILPYDSIRTTPKKVYEGQARAKFNFVAQTNLELSLTKGEVVALTRRVDDNWYEGHVGNRKGIFPISYVEVIMEPGHRSETPTQSKPVASPAAHSLLANASSGGKMSMGPHHYVPSIPVNINTTQPHYNSLPQVGGSKLHVSQLSETLHVNTHSEPIPYRVLYNYKPQNEDELELKEGDMVYMMEKCDDGWYIGSNQRTGYFGTFPGNYVERL